MKRFIVFFVVAMMTVSAYAETMKFEVRKAGNGVSYGTHNLSLAIADQSSKFSCDANNCYFDPASPVKFEARLKTGSKSSEKSYITLVAKEAGTLKIFARTAANASSDRNIVLTQNDAEILNHVLLESEKMSGVAVEGEVDAKDVYPVLTARVESGTITLTYPVNAVNLYGFELVPDHDSSNDESASDSVQNGKYCNYYGDMVIIKNGMKFNADGNLIM